jgi:hypothetical protein
MTAGIYPWCCTNPDCKMKNLAEQKQIDEAKQKGLKLLLVCANCGLGHKFLKIGTPNNPDWCACLPFKGWEAKLPTAINPDGTVKDYQGKSFDPDTFTTTYGVDGVQYIKWRDSGKPKPPIKC